MEGREREGDARTLTLGPGGGTEETLPAVAPGTEATLAQRSTAPAGATAWDAPPVASGATRYVELDEIGRGGLGRVTRAKDLVLDRTVALKSLLRSDQGIERRFVGEALVTARLQHPSIVPIYDAGRRAHGTGPSEPYYAMKLVAGKSLAELLEEAGTSDARLALLPQVLAVAQAVAFAHSQRVIHRDLKPHNVVVGEFGETVVIDWGLAKQLGAEDEQGTAPGTVSLSGDQTVAGDALGTPAYMAPEQARGEAVDARADVFALGAMLYHLLTGRPPYASDDVQETLAQARRGQPDALPESAPRELRAIATKAMAHAPGARYPTASELADDLQKFQTGQLVGSHRYTTWELLQRWVRRHRGAVAVGGVALTLLVVLGAVGVVKVLREQARTERQRAEAVTARRSAEDRLGMLELESGRQALLARDHRSAVAHLVKAHDQGVDTPAFRFVLAQALRPLRLEPTVLEPGDKLDWVAFSPDGARVVTSSSSAPRATVWSVDGARQFDLDLVGEAFASAQFSPDGRALMGVGMDGTVALWRAGDGTLIKRSRLHRLTIWRARFSLDGQRFATSASDGLVIVWSAATGEALATLRGHKSAVLDVAWAPDSTRLVSVGGDGTARIWDTTRGVLLHTLVGDPHALIRAVAVHPGGRLIAIGVDRVIQLWALDSGARLSSLAGHGGAVETLSFSRDGRLLSTSWDGTAKIWDVEGGRLITSLEGHKGRVWSGQWSPDGTRVLTTSVDGSGRLWDPRGALMATFSGHSADVFGSAIDPRGRLAATASDDGTARLWPLVVEGDLGVLAGHEGMISAVGFSEDGRLLVTSGHDRTVRVWDARTQTEIARFTSKDPTPLVALLGSGSDVVIAEDRRIVIQATDTGPAREVALPFVINQMGVAHGGARIFALSRDDELALVDVASGRVRLVEVGRPITAASFGGEGGELLAIGLADGRVSIRDADDGGEVVALGSHQRAATSVAFCAGGARLLSTAADGVVKLWDTRSGQALRSLVLPPGSALPVPSPDCALLLVAGSGHPLAVLDGIDGRMLDHIEVRGEASTVAASRDWRYLAAPDGDRVWVWEIDPRPAIGELIRTAHALN